MTVILVTLLWASITAYYANKKGLSVILWGALGGFFGILGFLLCLTYNSFKTAKARKEQSL